MSYFRYWGPFVWKSEVEKDFVSLLLEKGNEAKALNQDHRKYLAGQLEHEYYYKDTEEWFNPLFKPHLSEYLNQFVLHWNGIFEVGTSFEIHEMWINYQGPGEYNPPHTHKGDLSFIIYLQVPDEIRIENEERGLTHNNFGPGMINFNFNVPMSWALSIWSYMPMVKDLIIFPSWLEHYVNDFKSDVERISMSGNLKFEANAVE